MRWTERQRARLQEIGIRVWERPREAAPPAAVALSVDAERRVVTVPGADTGSMATLDWPALRAAAAVCRACALCAGRTHSVFGAGNEQAHWMIVGGAPSADDDAAGEPFVGAAGQLLDNMLRAIHLTRGMAAPSQQVCVTNVVKCQPPQGRNPEPGELERCAMFLTRQVQLVQPRIILAMGRFALLSLLGSSEPMGRLRGRVHQHRGVPVIATYDPAYLLRNPEDKAGAWDDLCLAVQTLKAQAPR